MLCIEMPKLEYRDVRRGDLNEHTIKLLKEARDIITKKYSEDRFVMFYNIRDFPKTASEVKKFNPDVIIDDYIQLVTPTGKEDTRRLQLERICNDYKWLAKENDCAVVIASQLNRKIESRGGEVILGYQGDICTIYDDLPRINQGGSNDNRQIPFD